MYWYWYMHYAQTIQLKYTINKEKIRQKLKQIDVGANNMQTGLYAVHNG